MARRPRRAVRPRPQLPAGVRAASGRAAQVPRGSRGAIPRERAGSADKNHSHALPCVNANRESTAPRKGVSLRDSSRVCVGLGSQALRVASMRDYNALKVKLVYATASIVAAGAPPNASHRAPHHHQASRSPLAQKALLARRGLTRQHPLPRRQRICCN